MPHPTESTPQEEFGPDDPLLDLYRQATEPPPMPPHLADSVALVMRCREEIDREGWVGPPLPAPPEPPPAPLPVPGGRLGLLHRVRSHPYAAVAASVLVIIGAVAVCSGLFGGPKERPSEQLAAVPEFIVIATPSSLSGPEVPPGKNPAVSLTIPPLPAEVFGQAGHGYAAAIEFFPTERPRVRPNADGLSPRVVPGEALSLGAEPFIRPKQGSKWVVILVTDRPAAGAIARLVAAGHEFDREAGREASAKAAIDLLRAEGYQVLTQGIYVLKPMPQ